VAQTIGQKMASPKAGLWKVWERMPERRFYIALQHEFRKCEMPLPIAIHATDGTENRIQANAG
jgi:hypothetical protein